MEHKGYRARVEFDHDAGVFFGEVEGLKDVVTFEATTVAALKKAFRASVDDYLEMCSERGEEPEKPYSGKFLIRMDPVLHREVAAAAARSGKSLNQFASEVLRAWLAGARPSRKRVAEPMLYPSAIMAAPGQLSNAVMAPTPVQSFWFEGTEHTPRSLTPGTPVASLTPQ